MKSGWLSAVNEPAIRLIGATLPLAVEQNTSIAFEPASET